MRCKDTNYLTDNATLQPPILIKKADGLETIGFGFLNVILKFCPILF